MINKQTVYLLILTVVFLVSCKNDKLEALKNVDVTSVESPKLAIHRMEDDIFSLNPDSINAATPALQKKYGNFYLHYIRGFINDGGIADSGYTYNLARFISDKDMKEAYSECKKKYPSVDFLEQGLEDAFKRYLYYFPKRIVPRVYTMFTGFNYSVVYVDTTLALSLEMYLGKDNKFYSMMPPDIFPMYRRRNMDKQFLIPDCIRAWLSLEFPSKETQADLLTEMIYAGKILYLTDALLPYTHDTLKIGYTQKQLSWCEKNEFNMWAFFIDNKLLYTTDLNEIMKFTTDGPFTAAFNKESPARVGQWIGWNIVRSYMTYNTETTVAELFDIDAQTILTRSKYKPSK